MAAKKTLTKQFVGADSRGNPGTWRHYSDGSKTFTASGGSLSISAAQQYELSQKKGAARPSAAGAAAGAPGPVAASPGVPQYNPVQPFALPDDAMNFAMTQGQLADQLWGIDSSLGSLKANTEYETGQVDKAANKASGQTVEAMLARGLGSSSIKDAEIYDIAASAATRKNFLQTALSTATIEGGRRKKILGDTFDAFQTAYNQKMSGNAEGKNAELAAAAVAAAPPAAPAPAPTPAAPAGPKLRSYVKDGWFYREASDGSGRFLRIRPASGGR